MQAFIGAEALTTMILDSSTRKPNLQRSWRDVLDPWLPGLGLQPDLKQRKKNHLFFHPAFLLTSLRLLTPSYFLDRLHAALVVPIHQPDGLLPCLDQQTNHTEGHATSPLKQLAASPYSL